VSMANEPDAPAQLYRSLNERLEHSDKEGAIELYYELLSSGRSVGEILNGVGLVHGGSAQDSTPAAEQAESGRGEAQTGITAEVAAAGDSRPGAPSTGDPDLSRAAEGPRNASLEELGPGAWRQLLSQRSPGAEPSIDEAAGAHASATRESAADFADRERFRLPSVATSIAFWALYSGAVACASIAGFSLLRGARDTQPIAGESSVFRRTEAVPTSATVADRSAVPEVVEPQAQSVGDTGSQPPQSSPKAEPDAAASGVSQRVAVGGRAPVSPDTREAMAPPRSDTGPPDAIGKLIMQLTDLAEAPRDSTPATSVGPSSSITPTGPAETPPLSDAGRNAGDTPPVASTGEARATAPTGGAAAALPSPPLADKGRRAHAPRRDARLRRSPGRRHPAARYPQTEYARERRPAEPDRTSGAQDIDVARGYGHGAYGPAPYSDTGN
jgi:hypothetical protein